MAETDESSHVADRLARYFRGSGIAGLVSVYLFGSHACGHPHRQSDVDVGVLLDWAIHPTAAARFEVRTHLAAELPGVVRAPADIVILNDVPPGLGRAVVTRGMPVFVASPALDHAYVRDIQLRAADLDPWLKRMRTVKLRAVRQ